MTAKRRVIGKNCRAGASPADPSNGKRERLPYKSVIRDRRSEGKAVAHGFQISGIKSNSRLGRRSWEGWMIDDVHDSLQNRDDDSLVNIESLFSSFSSEASF